MHRKKKEDISTIAFRHSQNLPLGIDIFTLEELYVRFHNQPQLYEVERIDFYMLIYVTEGIGRHFVDFVGYDVEPDTLLIVSKNQIQQYDWSRRINGHMVLFTEDFLRRALFDFDKAFANLLFEPITTNNYCLKQAHALRDDLERLIQEYHNGPDDSEKVSILSRQLGIIMLKAERLRRKELSSSEQMAESSTRLIAFRDLLEANFQSQWTAQQYAEKLGISRKTLGNLTRKNLNRTPKEVIDQRLILEIKRMLAHSDYSIKEIAFALGFSEATNMVKYFNRLEETTPSDFRRKVRTGQ